ncbi:hypothetical protein HW555_014072 [Spodoptera exigua]|uniref:Uncharacterized protein n=1 Tax=Spodoptera exigua TaxID=7107 RepID=A0A835G4F4_SPOEX|nr:hypothetical protein HW555_014072 [Spodoptera exigua]
MALLYSFFVLWLASTVGHSSLLPRTVTTMSKLTGFPNTSTPAAAGLTYRGIVENMSIPAELHERPDGKPYATFGDVVPIHCCTPEQVEQHRKTTHHYCDIFTDETLAPLGDLVYVRIDENTAEKVFINRRQRILVVSSDGVLAQWRLAPTFESANVYLAGTPIVDQAGHLVSVVTAKWGRHYAVSALEGEGGYFDTSLPWEKRTIPEGSSVYGNKTFQSRDELREYVASLPPPGTPAAGEATPLVYVGGTPRLVLVAPTGRQLSHHYLHGVITSDVEYL